MKVIGITGSVGSGKTTVAKILKEYWNAHLIITDDVAKELMTRGNISYRFIVEFFGDGILDSNQEIDRKKLGEIVFADKSALIKLNSFTHPYVREFVLEEIKRVKTLNEASFIVVETALLIEAGYQEFCDEVWYVTAKDSTKRQRLKVSRGYSDEKIDSILQNQLSDDEYRKYCKVVLPNDGDIAAIKNEIQNLLV